ncbi:MAG: tRNA (N6-isopentenyl adenosine(37)-C2)-methylthiotransferase MiaB [Elusimicrobia bacterium]|nr:tRNA (N6-isopentenyl adenosine(37)-C2)-methylthiotransferase MiaB [Elusimicrobiota bacterium]
MPALRPRAPLKLHTIALGCQMSAADGAEMSRPFYQRGFSAADSSDQADAILISTCTVRQHAEDRALSLIGALRPWKEAVPERILIVAGCAAERLGPWIRSRFPYVDLVVGAKSIEQFPALVSRALEERFDGLKENRDHFPASGEFSATNSPATAYVTIMRGCNYSCSYCVVPSVRGRELYRRPQEILGEVEMQVARGAREATLLGQTVNSYRSAAEERAIGFPELLRLLDAVPDLARLRFMSPHPYYVDEAFAAAMAECRTLCPFLHLPVQSGSNRLLKLMRRNYTRESYLERVKLLRNALPGIVFSTDIIVGLPSESEEDFRETLSLLEELSPASVYSFKYSPRQATEAASWADDVPQEVKEERLGRLNAAIEKLTVGALRSEIGKKVEVLCEQQDFGRTREGFKARWKNKLLAPGTLASLSVTSATTRTLLGEIQ